VDYQAHQGERMKFGLPVQRGVTAARKDADVVSVLLADDTPDMLTLMRMTFDFHDGTEVLGVAGDGRECVALWRQHRPDVVVMDLRMPVLSGLEAAAEMLSEDPGQLVVIFSAAFRPVDRDLADAIGVVRCFDKRDLDRLPELVTALGRRVRQA
jgi:DNA-binding NarL/FixJ family response regulator